MYEDIRKYIQKCDLCQRKGKFKRSEPLHLIKTEDLFYRIRINIVRPLPRIQNGNRYIITAMDYMTKWSEARALSEANVRQFANFIYEDIICKHGCLQCILSDRGTHFNNQLVAELINKFKIKHNFFTLYHPQTNELIEHFNRTLSELLVKLREYKEDWDLFIAPVLFTYQTS